MPRDKSEHFDSECQVYLQGALCHSRRVDSHTGNHARIIGLYVKDITEANKPKGYDKDVVVEEDVWIGCNVTLLSGVTIGRGTTWRRVL